MKRAQKNIRKKNMKKNRSERFAISVLWLSVLLCVGCGDSKTQNMECVLQMDDEEFLWMEKDESEKKYIGLYIGDGTEFEEIENVNIPLSTEADIVWEYEDATGDGKKDILITTEDAIWVLMQNEDGGYVLWDEEPLVPLLKRA